MGPEGGRGKQGVAHLQTCPAAPLPPVAGPRRSEGALRQGTEGGRPARAELSQGASDLLSHSPCQGILRLGPSAGVSPLQSPSRLLWGKTGEFLVGGEGSEILQTEMGQRLYRWPLN